MPARARNGYASWAHWRAASALPARAALLRWGALPAMVRSRLLTGWYGSQQSSSAA